MSDDDDNGEDDLKKSRHRSPNHPFINLEKAVEHAAALREKYGMHDIPVNLAHALLGYKPLSASGNQCIAALKAYGLIEVKGEGKTRKITVSSVGDRIVRNAPDRAQLLRDAVLTPPIHQEVLDHYGKAGLPDDGLLHQYLVWDRPEGSRFNEDSVGGFISRLRESLAFANLDMPDTIESANTGNTEEEAPKPEICVGKFVQWTSGGTDQFSPPRRVAGITDDQRFVFVENFKTGIPMSEITLVPDPSPATAGPRIPPSNPFYRQQDMEGENDERARETTKLAEGVVTLSMPDNLSGGSLADFEYWTQGIIQKMRRKSGSHKSRILPTGEQVHLIQRPDHGWFISSYEWSWLAGTPTIGLPGGNIMNTARVFAQNLGWEDIEFETPEDAFKFVREKIDSGEAPGKPKRL